MNVIHQIIDHLRRQGMLTEAQYRQLEVAGFTPAPSFEWRVDFDEENRYLDWEASSGEDETDLIHADCERKRPRHRPHFYPRRKHKR